MCAHARAGLESHQGEQRHGEHVPEHVSAHVCVQDLEKFSIASSLRSKTLEDVLVSHVTAFLT